MVTRLLRLLDTPLGRVARYGLSLGLLAWFAWRIDWRQFAGATDRIALPTALVAFFIVGLTYPLHAWRWRCLLRAQHIPLSYRWSHAVTWIGQFYNAFLLGGIGGDAARIFYLCRDVPDRRAAALSTIVIDRAIGLAALMSLAAFAMLAKFGTIAHDERLRWVFIGAVTVSAGIAATAIVIARLDPARWPLFLQRMLGEKRLVSLTDLLARLRAAPGEHVRCLAAAYGIWLGEFVATWLFARAVGLPMPFLETCIATAVAYAATGLPISVGGHGVREGALLLTLGLFGLVPESGIGHDRALLIALQMAGCTILWSLFGGLWALGARRLVPPPGA